MNPHILPVPPRILRRVIRRHRAIVGLGLRVPHADSYRIDGRELAKIAPDLARDGPVILLADGEEPRRRWRRTFHELVHLRIDLLAPARLREHVHRLGSVELDEIRRTLRQDHLLLPPQDERTIYAEFAARYLELRHFDREALDRFFPAVGRRRAEIEALLAEDVDAGALLEAARPAGFAEPPLLPGPTRILSAPAAEPRPLPAEAGEERSRGNLVGAALRSADASDLEALGARLRTIAEAPWAEGLRPLLAAAGGRLTSPEARLLYDLQAACQAVETTSYRVDVIEWALSLGRRPIRRPLEPLREVEALARLRRAEKRLGTVGLPRPARRPIADALTDATHALDRRIRARLRPVLDAGIAASGLRLADVVERLAAEKIAEELLDRVVERGFFTFGDVRDALARGQAKLADLSGPAEFWNGDALLRMDRFFAEPLEGVYRRGEVYLRWLQRFSSLAFGTKIGRGLTKYVALPFGGAFVALEGLQHMLHPPLAKLAHVHVHLTTRPAILGLGLFLLLLLHVAGFRNSVAAVLRSAGRTVAGLPRAFLRLAPVRFVRESLPWRLFVRFVAAPAVFAAPFLLLRRYGIAGAAFVAAGLFLNSAPGRAVVERAGDALVRSWHQIGREFVPGVVRWFLDVFHAAIDLLERGIYRVDEILRFRPGDSALSIAAKGAFGFVWFLVSYVARIYLTLLVEPQVNPVKHFPVVTVSHKIILPLTFTLTELLRAPLMPLGSMIANALAVSTVFLLPGVFGFLVWELKENWRLYRASRASRLRPVVVGSHGETVPRLLRPGFHSGTVPKLFAKLRRAKAEDRRTVDKLEAALHHVEESVGRFLERDYLALLRRTGPLALTAVRLSPIRIVAEIAEGEKRLVLSFEERAGTLVARATDHGLLPALPPDRRAALEAATAGLWHLAGADLSAAGIEAAIGTSSYDFADGGLVFWRGGEERRVPFDPDWLVASRPIAWSDWRLAWEVSPPPPLVGRFRVLSG